MEKIYEYLKNKTVLNKKTFSGVSDGEKVFLCYTKKWGVIVTYDFVLAVKLKKRIEELNKKYEIISTG